MNSSSNFIQMLTKAGPTILSAGGVAAVIWLAVEVVPRERQATMEDRAATRELFVLALEKDRAALDKAHAEHAEIMKKLDELLKKQP